MKQYLAEEEVKIVEESLQREFRLLESKRNLLKGEIEDFENRHKMTSEEFTPRFERGEIGDAQDFFEWWGLLKGLQRVEGKISKLKAVLVG
jgi:hypothetical protein